MMRHAEKHRTQRIGRLRAAGFLGGYRRRGSPVWNSIGRATLLGRTGGGVDGWSASLV
ncbi:MAG: hypothetical protein JXA73_15350 [Acidobacteria bacterium]|nr:hypothetical protein [Acidobacteriota bacterium]